jgi:DNA gyrase subunit A
VPNYDERLTEPVVFPASFPNLLINGGTGIAVGMATNIPPHNLSEVIDGLCALIDDPDISIEGLMQHIKGPDFPTGCLIQGTAGIRSYFETGRDGARAARLMTRSQGGREYYHCGNSLVNRAELVRRSPNSSTKVLQVSDVRDESDENTSRGR